MDEFHGRFLIDTNVLIYATLADDPRCQRAQAVIRLGLEDRFEAFVSVQNLAEMYPNLTGPKTNPPDKPDIARRKIDSLRRLPFVEVLPVTSEVVGKATELCDQHGVRRQNYFDMQLAATMLLNRIPWIVTENIKDFTLIGGIKAINPFV